MTVMTESQFQEWLEEFPEMEEFFDLDTDAQYDTNRYLWN